MKIDSKNIELLINEIIPKILSYLYIIINFLSFILIYSFNFIFKRRNKIIFNVILFNFMDDFKSKTKDKMIENKIDRKNKILKKKIKQKELENKLKELENKLKE